MRTDGTPSASGRHRHARRGLVAVALVAVLGRVIVACNGAPDLTESDSCKQRGGYCGTLGPVGEPMCNSLTDTVYLDTCVCCVPFDAASVVMTMTPPAGDASTSSDAGRNEAGMASESGASEGGASDAAADATDGGG